MSEGADPYWEALGQLRWLFDGADGREPGAASLATVDAAGKPSVRTVTIVAIADAGPAFFFRRASGKGQHLAEGAPAALCFYWSDQQYQVTLEGRVQALDPEDADRLWHQRPRDAKLLAWIRDVEPPAGEPDTVEARVERARSHFAWDRVPRPETWAGVCLCPDAMDFWHLVWRKPRQREHFYRDASGAWRKDLLPPL